MLRRFRLSAALLGLLVCGCGKEATNSASPGTPAGPPPSTPTVTMASLDGVQKAKLPVSIALIVKTRNNPFFGPMVEEFSRTATELGVTPDVQAPPQEMDKEKQFALVQAEVSKGVKAICIAPADSKGIVPALKAAQDAGVLVINLDNRVDKPTAEAQHLALAGYVGADNEAGGKLAGEAMVAALGAKGSVAIVEGIRGADNAESRKRGFETAVQGKLTVAARESADWETEKAYQKTQGILAAHPDVTGIFCANDMMAIGTMKAIAEAGKKGKVTVVGYDNIPQVRRSLASGELLATIEQHPDLMGKYGLRMAVGILNGQIPKGGEVLVRLDTIKK